MPVLQWALICNRVITDKETNSVSYIDALEGFAVAHLPFPFPPICVSTLWRRESDKDVLHPRIRIQDPSGKTVQSFTPEQPMPLLTKRHRLNVILGGAEIAGPGEFLIIIEQRVGKTWRSEATLPIDVSQLDVVHQGVPEAKSKVEASRVAEAVEQKHAPTSAARRR